MAGIQNGPLPSSLILLSDLHKVSPGAKVRFLGCVTNYSTKSASLTLEHNHPPGSTIRAQVDVELLLNTMKLNETRIGEWVNIIGYKKAATKSQVGEVVGTIQVQAIVIWSSGPLKLDGYERSLDLQNSDKDRIENGPENI